MRPKMPYLQHWHRRKEALPLLHKKFRDNTRNYLDKDRREQVLALLGDREHFDAMPVGDFVRLLRASPCF